MKLSKLFVIAAAAGMIGSATPAQADEFTDLIDEVLELYQAGDIGGAKDALDYAGQLLDQMKAGVLQSLFPEPIGGWEVEDTPASAVPFIGGITAGRTYSKDGEDVQITIMGDSPMVQQYGMIMSSPAMLQSSGGRMVRVNRQKGAITKDNELFFMIGGRFLVMFQGNASEEAKLAYAEAFDFAGLNDIP